MARLAQLFSLSAQASIKPYKQNACLKKIFQTGILLFARISFYHQAFGLLPQYLLIRRFQFFYCRFLLGGGGTTKAVEQQAHFQWFADAGVFGAFAALVGSKTLGRAVADAAIKRAAFAQD